MIYVFQVLALVAGAALASCGDGGASQDSSSATAIVRLADGCHAVPELRQKQVLLACEPFSRGRELQVRTERDSGGQDGCLEIYGMGRGKSRACGYDEASMRAASLARPFGYFVAELPPGSSRARATPMAGGGRSMRMISLALDTYHPPFLYARE